MKWIVSSTTSPIAMLPIIIVNMSMVTPVQPITPKVSRIGVRLGTMLAKPVRRFASSRIMSGVMIARARE